MTLELFTLIGLVAILGGAVWVVTTTAPMPAPLVTTAVVTALLGLLGVARACLTGGEAR